MGADQVSYHLMEWHHNLIWESSIFARGPLLRVLSGRWYYNRLMRKKTLSALLVFGVSSASLLWMASTYAAPIKPEHRLCQQDADCGIVKLECFCCPGGKNDAVNKEHAKKFEKFCPMLSCERMSCLYPEEVPAAVCRQGQCALLMRPAPPPPPPTP